MGNIAHENANAALDRIKAIRETETQKVQGEYLSLVRGADAMIHQCGLLQTLAFYRSKQKPHHNKLTSHVLEHLELTHDEAHLQDGYRELLGMDDGALMHKTAEARQYLLWLKRYAEAMLGEGGGT